MLYEIGDICPRSDFLDLCYNEKDGEFYLFEDWEPVGFPEDILPEWLWILFRKRKSNIVTLCDGFVLKLRWNWPKQEGMYL